MAKKITSREVDALTAPGKYHIGEGLYLEVRSPTSRSWVFRYFKDRKTRYLGLGSAKDISLTEARNRRAVAHAEIVAGRDPVADRKAEAAAAEIEAKRATTFQKYALRLIESREAGWRNPKHRQQWRNSLTAYAFPVIGAMRLDAITTADVLNVLHPIWSVTPETANRVRGRIEMVLSAAAVEGLRPSGDNPARWRGHLDHLLPRRSKIAPARNHAALPYSALPAFMVDLRAREAVAARALEWLILTATRTGETLGTRWEEIDPQARIWTIPPTRMKAGKPHRVPLSDAAMAVLDAAREFRDGDLVFPGQRRGKPLSNMALLVLLKRMGRADITGHGFRSTFRDWSAEATSYPSEIAEAALAHTTKSKVEAAYLRTDHLEKRRALMADWARFATTPPAVAATVTPIRRKPPASA